MDFEIRTLNRADGEDERLVLFCTDDANIGDYMVMDTTFDKKGNRSNIFRHVYPFIRKQIKKGEFVVLYTRSGLAHSKGNTHFFFMGSKANVWNDNHDSVTLYEIADSEQKKFTEIEK